MFESYLAKWGLVPDGDPIVTRAVRLLPVLRQGGRAITLPALDADIVLTKFKRLDAG